MNRRFLYWSGCEKWFLTKAGEDRTTLTCMICKELEEISQRKNIAEKSLSPKY